MILRYLPWCCISGTKLYTLRQDYPMTTLPRSAFVVTLVSLLDTSYKSTLAFQTLCHRPLNSRPADPAPTHYTPDPHLTGAQVLHAEALWFDLL